MQNLFDVIPESFFNYLGSGSNNRIYSDCLQIIYQEYDREISYRIPRIRIRDAVASYLLENEIDYHDEDTKGMVDYNSAAGSIIRKLCAKDVSWLEEDNDDVTYEKQIIMTEQGVMLAEFLQTLRKPEKEEFSSYIFNIYNTLRNTEQWSSDPYVNALKPVYRNAKSLSKALKKLATFIRKIIERMVNEETLESLTENLLEYCEGDFIKEYARLTKQQNIHIYRTYIRRQLEDMKKDQDIFDLMVIGCVLEDEINEREAEERVMDMLQRTQRFLTDDYDRLIRDIKHKINLYLQIAIGRARFIRNREADVRGSVDQTIRYLVEEMQTLDMKDELPDELNDLFYLEKNEFIDLKSLRFPRKQISIRQAVADEIHILSEEDRIRAIKEQEKEAYNPYSKELMKSYLEKQMGTDRVIRGDQLPMRNKNDLLSSLSAVAYGQENGFVVEPKEGYFETDDLIIRNFEIRKGE